MFTQVAYRLGCLLISPAFLCFVCGVVVGGVTALHSNDFRMAMADVWESLYVLKDFIVGVRGHG